MLSMAAICNLTSIHTFYDENCTHLVRSLAQIGCDRALIGNGNGTEWSPIRSVIIRVINKICDIIGYFLNQNTRNSKVCFASSEKKAM